MNRVYCFFLVFGTVYFLESIGGFYMSTAIVYIERQFQIPSRVSGSMVSAGDFAYIPLVIFTGYFGGKGNRAKWIGAGCMLIAGANLLISMSNFLFPAEIFQVKSSDHVSSLAYQTSMFAHNKSEEAMEFMKQILADVDPDGVASGSFDKPLDQFSIYHEYCSYIWTNNSLFTNSTNSTMFNDALLDNDFCKDVENVFDEIYNVTIEDVAVLRYITQLPYSLCSPVIALMRREHQHDECQRHSENYGPFFMIFTGLLILGVGRTMPFSLGLPLMDDNVKKTNLPVYFAIMFFMKILGPVLGLLVGSQLNKIYTTFSPPPGLTPSDPKWIGCWWLGFLLFGCLLFFPSLMLFCFPADDLDEDDQDEEAIDPEKKKMLDGVPEPEKPVKRRQKLNLRDKHVKKEDEDKNLFDMFHEVKLIANELIHNKIFVGAILGRIVDVLAFKGFFVYLSKYVELQFGVPQYRIQRYLAGTGVVGFAIGMMTGSLVTKRFKFTGRQAAAWVATSSAIAALLTFVNGAVGCKSAIGLMGDEAKLYQNMSFPSCRPECFCDEMPFYPVCNSQGEVFYSPCHAGCGLSSLFHEKSNTTEDPAHYMVAYISKNQTFTNCSCAGTEDMTISRFNCETEQCEFQFKLFFIVQSIGSMVGGLGVVPGMLIILRAVSPEHRSISLGINGFLVSLLATLPSPILWGKIIDTSCVLWGQVCGKGGACEIYDTDRLRISLHLIYGGMRVFSLLSDVWVYYWSKDLKILEESEVTSDKSTSNEVPKVAA